MPRRRNVEFQEPPSVDINDIGQNTIHLVSSSPPVPTKFMVGEYLKNSYFEMAMECKKKLECPVCLEEICCKRCCSVLPCGHHYHLSCLIKLDKCALCRS